MVVKKPSLPFLFLVSFLASNLCKAQQDRNPIELENGAYKNILIAIDKDVEEDPSIIENIKKIFSAGSPVLFNATNRRVYFGSITILVPLTWSKNSEYQVAQREAFENANVLVTNQDSNLRPYVDNPFGCGRQGRFIRFSKTFTTDEDLRENEFGDSGKIITRQFAKLRWGVFDEDYVPGTDAEPYYQSNAINGGLEGTRCSPEVLGEFLDGTTATPCQTDPSGDFPESCRFVPSQTGQTAKASLMFASNIHSIGMFCDNQKDESGYGYHNYEAPNLQNKKCDYQSVWEVMRKSLDFRYGNSPPLPEDTDTSPNFSVVQPLGELRIVLTLDTSGSMDGERFEKMIKGARNFIRSLVPDNSYVAIVEFNTESTVNSDMVELTDATSRENLMFALPTDASGNTCIGCGILKAIEVAQYNGMDSRGVYLILLSDGMENEEPHIAETLDDIEDSGVIVQSIAFSEADIQMEELAQMTGGTSSTCPDGGSAQCVISAFASTITQRPQSVDSSAPIQVQSSAIDLDPASISTIDILIDASLGLNTIMTITWTVNDMISITVTGPDDTVIDSTDSRYEIDLNYKLITITIEEAEAGVWSIEIGSSTSVEFVSVNVYSQPRSEGIYPPVVNSFLGTTMVDYTTSPLVEIYAYVHINYEPVLDAIVTAEIDSSITRTVTSLVLLDDGRGADLIAGDGIYSAYFLEFSSDGRYGVKVDVIGNTVPSSNTQIRLKRDVATQTPPPTDPIASTNFTRTTTAGVVQVVNYDPDLNIDILAPSKITDFASRERTYDDNRNVTLTWSAVGDDLDKGTAAYYELRYSENFTQIRTNFSSSTAINDTDVILGNLSRVASSGNLESITILLPGENLDAIYSFMIRAWDEAGNAGSLSNIVSVSRRPLQPAPTTMPTSIPSSEVQTTSEVDLQSTSSPGPGVVLPSWAIIILACMAGLIVIAVAVIVSMICVRCTRPPKMPKKVRSLHDEVHVNDAFNDYHDYQACQEPRPEPRVFYIK